MVTLFCFTCIMALEELAKFASAFFNSTVFHGSQYQTSAVDVDDQREIIAKMEINFRFNS